MWCLIRGLKASFFYLQTNNEELHRSRSAVLYEEVKRDRNVRVIDEGREMVVRFAVEVTDRFKLEDGLHTESMFSPFLEGHAGRQDPTRASVVYAVCRWHCDLLQEYRASQEDPGEYILWGKKTPMKVRTVHEWERGQWIGQVRGLVSWGGNGWGVKWLMREREVRGTVECMCQKWFTTDGHTSKSEDKGLHNGSESSYYVKWTGNGANNEKMGP